MNNHTRKCHTLIAAISLFFSIGIIAAAQEPSTQIAANATNALGMDLHRRFAQASPDANLCVSPYSIQNALAMTYLGSAGITRDEMSKALHYPPPLDEVGLHESFAALKSALDAATRKTLAMQLLVANRLFGQAGFDFRPTFLEQVNQRYGAPLEVLDFKQQPADAAAKINTWVAAKTQQRIRDLIPSDALNERTRLVLVNALYFKASWAESFGKSATKDEPFTLRVGTKFNVPTMLEQGQLKYRKRDGYEIVAMDYAGGDLQFVIFLPKEPNGLAAMEKSITPQMLADCTRLTRESVILHLPKFRLEPPLMNIGDALKALGMKSAFDVPAESANFWRMAPRKPNEYLCISDVFHKTFLAIDEEGSEAAAATAVITMVVCTACAPGKRIEPIEVRVNRPFVFAIQHVPSGACLFLGRVIDPH